jgi:cell fate regulator YaaT (PSP1 superfamily)
MSDEYMGEETITAETEPVISEEGYKTVMVKFSYCSETMVCSTDPVDPVQAGEMVIVSSRYGKDLARVLGPLACGGCGDETPPAIIRRANEQDVAIFERNQEREREAFTVCKEKILSHKLDMKLVAAHYLLDEPKVLFFFTAESRVDFRALVKDLVSVFKMRIELRQIGVRDESRVLGGIAVCGRQFCCHGVTDNLKPVSIKMAKEQNLSLNSMKISGPCGRLLCCLSYEYDFYREEKGRVPQEGARVKINGVQYKVIDVNILAKKVHFLGPEARVFEVPFSNVSRGRDNEWIVDFDPEDSV